ncbi:methyltransferase [bacterium]|nr:methyltransferase [bacterium]
MVRDTYEIETKLGEKTRTLRAVGGLFSKDKIATSTQLLLRAMQVKPGDHVLDYGCGYGAVGIALSDAAPDLDIQMVDLDIRAVRMAQRNVHANEIGNASVVLDHALSRFSNGHFNVVALNPPVEEGTETIFEMIERAQSKLRHGGSFYLVAKVRKGAKSYMRKMSGIIGPSKVVLRSGGYWVMRAERSAICSPGAVNLSRYEHVVEDELRGRRYKFHTYAGIFSRKAVDEGTHLLVETMEMRPRHSVIDIGCGYGPIGIAAAHAASVGRVVMVDCNARAVEYAEMNIREHHLNHARKNGKPRVEAVLGDRFDAVTGERFDRVISNPPFHAGNDVLFPIVDEAREHLRIHGRLYVVLMRYVGVQRYMRKVFGNCHVAADNGRYVVLMSERTI